MTISSHLSYLEKQAFCPLQIGSPPDPALGMVVVIPCHNEPDLISSLNALWNCHRPGCSVEIIVVINSGTRHGPEIHKQNEASRSSGLKWAESHQEASFQTHFLYFPELPAKHAGVGLARKVGMDEAVGRLVTAGREEAPIVCFDADAHCDPNYLQAIETHFKNHPETPACSIHFEHPLDGDLHPLNYEGIIRYELYLRYYVEALRYAGHPHAYHTIGSSMAARSSAYQAQGGMNRRKAGEDFHFLQKMIPLGGFTEVRETRVIPSPRISERVPFGTGKAMTAWLKNPDWDYPVYGFGIFEVLKSFLERVRRSYGESADSVMEGLDSGFQEYLRHVDFTRQWADLIAQTTSESLFFKRFFRWFNGLEVLHSVHFLRESDYPDIPVLSASRSLLEKKGRDKLPGDVRGLLELYREIQRFGPPFPR